MKLDVFFVDAFSSELFSGNPAAVIFSDLNDDVLMLCEIVRVGQNEVL